MTHFPSLYFKTLKKQMFILICVTILFLLSGGNGNIPSFAFTSSTSSPFSPPPSSFSLTPSLSLASLSTSSSLSPSSFTPTLVVSATSSPSSPFEEPSPQSLLPLDDLIPNQSSTTSREPDAATTVLEDQKSTYHSHAHRTKQRKEKEIVRLLKELKYCANAKEAKTISQQIQRLWAQSGSETIDLLMTWAEQGISEENYGLALDYLDTAIALSPTYAEAWSRRAWIHIQLSDFKLAMLDLHHALQLEPRNYIAFFELGIVMEATQRPELAIKAYETALTFYPQMQKVQNRIDILLSKNSDQNI
ncbi:tetratricopeptide repeat protein [Bartonella bovis 91-4]|uniref:Tetratricopeptide repeat protein n=2 Tax=Bartonella bovis TaxID=155194 RepID=N6UJ10_9HYPH|nr:tetratricopeptide repeat protein [Bartonella bovis 91-4]